jgi:hypothetical protein
LVFLSAASPKAIQMRHLDALQGGLLARNRISGRKEAVAV